ncbi:uncharacterized protein Z518_07150 [Rhinocladiella mackenziei CBS 650.93]|uniref:Uncharacterized protein n=1 Tax=Rhinocladiella mackenziei CBS 650.93 TaxID=1442369 RepID=A0A0D2FNH4_9EURO|nr:uncharacterized protein Z518_07150 [Rhinocladiella mackenziei CBS 650.93]KIX03597.1 hypothetical protein Z518_07150 [Rhinocladiella mackenziei CBS 650.93]
MTIQLPTWARRLFSSSGPFSLDILGSKRGNYRHTSKYGSRISANKVHGRHTNNDIPPKSTRSSMWNSAWLSWYILGGVSAIFALSVGALISLWHYNVREDGFKLITTNHYSWTYGPTAILVVFVAIWRQVDQSCKLLTPWQVLQRGDAPSNTTILLDYISPLQIVSFWTSLKNRHWIICLTILAFFILKLITLVSTGLFFTDLRTALTTHANISTSTSFDGSLYNASAYLGVTDSSLFYTAYAVMAKGLPDAEGTQGRFAYQSLSLTDNVPGTNATINTVVDVFVPSFNCEKAEVTINLQPANTTDQHPDDTINLLSPPCKLLAGAMPIYALNPQLYKCPSRQLSGLMQRVDCSGQNTSTPVGNWQLLTITDMRYSQTPVANNSGEADVSDFEFSTWSTEVAQVSSIVCRPSYTIQKRPISYDFTQTLTNITLGAEIVSSNRSLEQFKDEDLGVMFTSAYSAAALMFGNKADSETAEEYPDTMFRTMAEISGGSYENLLDANVMMEAAEKVFDHVAVQIAVKNLLRQQTTPLAGDINTMEERLYVRALALWIMVAGFALLPVISVLVFIYRPRNVVAHDPELISSMVTLLAESPAFEEVLCSRSSVEDQDFDRTLDEYKYVSFASADSDGQLRFAIELIGAKKSKNPTKAENTHWWKPLLLRRPVMIIILALPPALITVLEILQHLSRRTLGIARIQDPRNFVTEASTRFLPALAMLLISTSFNALDFNIALLAPYHALKSRKGSEKTGIFGPIVGKIPPAALWASFKHGHRSAIMSTSGALLGSLLTIIVSGLLVIDTVTITAPAELQVLDTFQPDWTNSVTNDSSAAVVASLIEAANLTYPSSTYGDLAFPLLKADRNTSEFLSSDTRLEIQMPAYRGSLVCGILRNDQFNVSGSYNSRILSSGASIEASFPLPAQCPFGGPGGNLSTLDYEYFFQLPSNTNQSFIGKMLDLHVGPYSGPFAASSDELSPYTQPNNPAGCPTLAFIYGYIDVQNMSNSVVSTMACSQVIEKLDAQVTLNAKDFSIFALSPPAINESSSMLLPSGPDNQTSSGRTTPTAFPYRLQVHMDQSLSLFNQTEYSSSSLSSQPPVDNFFQAVLFGRTPVPQELMRKSDDDSQNRVRQGIQNFYRRYMAQAISTNMRVRIPESTVSASNTKRAIEPIQSTLPGTLVNIPTSVLRQNNTSKLILQIFLAIMFICGLIAVLLNPTQEVVPYNPCTIAGAASLVAGSTLVREVAGAGGDGEKDSIMRNNMIQLGWWSDYKFSETRSGGEGVRRRRYGIDMVHQHE